ncbi:MAG TPA: hypothetical protein VM939_04355, partial [Gemmatimonadaceae bacterium]|nr:hypothetical protein [Gemmatimonadaceae bacterium]
MPDVATPGVGRDETSHPIRSLDHYRKFGTVVVFSSMMGIGIAMVYWVSRIGFENPVSPVVNSAALALFLFNAPYAFQGLLARLGRSGGWITSYSFIWLATLALTAIAGRLVPILGVNPSPVIRFVGVAVFTIVFLQWAIRGRTFSSLLVPLLGLFMGGWAAGVVWGRIYKSPLFTEMMALDGIVHHDAVGLAALGNMLRTYGVASVGLDGLPYMPYH